MASGPPGHSPGPARNALSRNPLDPPVLMSPPLAHRQFRHDEFGRVRAVSKDFSAGADNDELVSREGADRFTTANLVDHHVRNLRVPDRPERGPVPSSEDLALPFAVKIA
jgi:hypothetical protein